MENGNVKIILVVAVVVALSGAGVYSMVLTDSHVISSSPGEDVLAAFEPDQVEEEEPGELTQQPGDDEEPPPEEPAASSSVADKAPVAKKPEEKTPISQDFDPMLGERFSESEFARESSMPLSAGGSTPEEDQKKRDEEKIDKQIKKMGKRLEKKVNTITGKMKLDQRLREDILDLSKKGLEQIAEIRKQFSGQQMSQADRDYMRDRIKATNAETADAMRSLLGNKQFAQYQKESKYYDNPQARILDEMQKLKRQNDVMQKKIDRQNRTKPKSSNRSRGWRPRRR